MKKLIFILFILVTNNLYSQKIIVIDSVNKKPIPFVTIKLNNEKGTYTDENGFFELIKNSNDTIKLSHISFDEINVKSSEIKDTIVMSPNAVIIKEIIVSNGKEIINYIDFPKKKSSYNNFPVYAKSEIITFITPNKENREAKILKIHLNFIKNTSNNKNTSTRTAFRVNIYSSTKNRVEKKIFSSETYVINFTKKNKIEVDLKNENIEFSSDGIFISIEALGDMNNEGKFIENQSSINPILSENNIDDYSSTTYIRYIFNNSYSLKPINEFLEKISNKKIKRNLSFGLTISK
jgi:hypothetical protein